MIRKRLDLDFVGAYILMKNNYVRLALVTSLGAMPWLLPWNFGPTPVFITLLFSWFVFGIFISYLFQSQSGLEKNRIPCEVAYGWILAGFISCVIAYLQYSGIAEDLQPWVSPSKLGEAYANLRQRNQFATLTNIALVALIFIASDSRSLSVHTIFGFIAIILAGGNAISSSRTGMAELVSVVLFTLWWHGHLYSARPSSNRTIVGLAVIGYCVVATVAPGLLGGNVGSGNVFIRFYEDTHICSSRLTLWSNVLHLIAQKPWLGWGWGNLDYAHFITLYPGERFCEILDNAHNLPLHLAVELGIPVALALCGLCGWLVWRSRPWAETDATRQMAWGVLAVIGLHSMLEYPLWYGPFQLAAVLCLWMLWRQPEPTAWARQERRRTFLVPAMPLALVLAAACVYAAWDYWRISQIYLSPSARAAAYREDTLAKIQGTVFFKDQVKFAELTITPLTPANAAHIHALAQDMLHFSPESRVVEKLIESAVMLGDDAQALFYLERFKAAFPAEHARWSTRLKPPE